MVIFCLLYTSEMKMVSGPFGPTPTCEPYPEQPLEALLAEAVQNVHGEITAYDLSLIHISSPCSVTQKALNT